MTTPMDNKCYTKDNENNWIVVEHKYPMDSIQKPVGQRLVSDCHRASLETKTLHEGTRYLLSYVCSSCQKVCKTLEEKPKPQEEWEKQFDELWLSCGLPHDSYHRVALLAFKRFIRSTIAETLKDTEQKLLRSVSLSEIHPECVRAANNRIRISFHGEVLAE